MKRVLATAILAVPMLVMAQQPQAPAQPAETTNLVVHEQAPTYTDIYCSGFVTKENIPTTNHIVAGMGSPHSVRFVARQTVYLAGPGYAVGNRYAVIRKVKDPNTYEMAPGQNALLKKSGNEYAELGQVVITYIDKEVAVGEVEFSCSAMAPGDTLLPFHEKEMVKFSARPKFQVFAPYGGTAGRIIDGKEFDKILGTGQKVYVSLGANQGVHPGDYLRITRNYNPSEMAPVDRYSLDSPYVMDEAQDAVKLTKSDYKKLPARGIGEMVVLSVTPETATGMITLALEDVAVGDVVEVQAKQ